MKKAIRTIIFTTAALFVPLVALADIVPMGELHSPEVSFRSKKEFKNSSKSKFRASKNQNENSRLNGNIDETTFLKIINFVENTYRPLFARENTNLILKHDWQDSRPFAFAGRGGDDRVVTIFGGLARHFTMTEDSLALVLCHEIGHHLGGAPRMIIRWLAHEGQSDYFATAKCAKVLWGQSPNYKILRKRQSQGLKIPEYAIQKCRLVYEKTSEQALCIRSIIASRHLAEFIWSIRRDIFWNQKFPRLEEPSRIVVKKTLGGYPTPQCRLDTFVAGALCPIDGTSLTSEEDPDIGYCHGGGPFPSVGLRPSCWFRR